MTLHGLLLLLSVIAFAVLAIAAAVAAGHLMVILGTGLALFAGAHLSV